MWQRILVATDGSEKARKAEAAGIETARRFGADILFVHAVMDAPSDTEYGGIEEALRAMGPQPLGSLHPENLVEGVAQATGKQDLETPHEALHAFGHRLLEQAAERAREAGVAVDTRLADGKPAQVIADVASQEGADLIVVGTRGLGGLQGVLVGSVARSLVQDAEQSCLVVKA